MDKRFHHCLSGSENLLLTSKWAKCEAENQVPELSFSRRAWWSSGHLSVKMSVHASCFYTVLFRKHRTVESSFQMPLRLENKMIVVHCCSLAPVAEDSLAGIMAAVVESLNRGLRKNISCQFPVWFGFGLWCLLSRESSVWKQLGPSLYLTTVNACGNKCQHGSYSQNGSWSHRELWLLESWTDYIHYFIFIFWSVVYSRDL